MDEYYISWIDQAFVNPKNNERLDWLRENLHRHDWQFHGPGSVHPNTICFQRKEDALAFKLKFGL